MFAWQCIDLYNTLDKYKSHHAHFDLIIITLAEISKPKKEVTSDFFAAAILLTGALISNTCYMSYSHVQPGK